MFANFHNKTGIRFKLWNALSTLYLYLLQTLQMEWELENLGHPELVKGEEDAKLGNCILTANPNMILITALICQIFSPKSQLIWLLFKLPKKQPSPTLTLLHSQPNSPPPVASRGPSSPTCAPQPTLGSYTCSLWGPLSCLPPTLRHPSSGPCTRPTPLLSFKIQYSLHTCTEPSLLSIVTYLLIWAHLISSPRPQAPWWQAQNYLGIDEKILETEVCVDRYVWDRNETKPTCRLDPDKVQGPRLKGKERYEWRQQHYLLWLHLIYRPTLFLGLSCHRFQGPTLEMRTEVGSSQLLGGSNAVVHRTHQEKYHLRTANRVGHWTPPHREDQVRSWLACGANLCSSSFHLCH